MSRDEAWFEVFYQRHRRAVDSYCVRRVGVTDAGDAAAQVFATAWRRRDVVPDGESAQRWLYGVCRRVISHHWRGTRRARNLADKAGVMRQVVPPGPEVVVIASAEQQLVRDAVMAMSPPDREVLLLSAWEGLTHAEIAEVVGATHSAVDKRVARAKVRLARRYEMLAGARSDIVPVDAAAVSRVRAQKGGDS